MDSYGIKINDLKNKLNLCEERLAKCEQFIIDLTGVRDEIIELKEVLK